MPLHPGLVGLFPDLGEVLLEAAPDLVDVGLADRLAREEQLELRPRRRCVELLESEHGETVEPNHHAVLVAAGAAYVLGHLAERGELELDLINALPDPHALLLDVLVGQREGLGRALALAVEVGDPPARDRVDELVELAHVPTVEGRAHRALHDIHDDVVDVVGVGADGDLLGDAVLVAERQMPGSLLGTVEIIRLACGFDVGEDPLVTEACDLVLGLADIVSHGRLQILLLVPRSLNLAPVTEIGVAVRQRFLTKVRQERRECQIPGARPDSLGY